jgi:hypothetical protein
MSVQQIPALLKSMRPQFKDKNAIKISSSQFNMMKEIIREHCLLQDANRLYGIIGRMNRRMQKPNNPHLWETEFEYFANSMLQSLKENNYCRLEDSIDDINEIFMRQNNNSKPGKNRVDDKSRFFGFIQ